MSPSFVLTLLLLPAASPLQAQAALTYLERYREIRALAPVPDKVADVSDLVLRRDVAELRLDRGKLYLLSNVGGRAVGAVFKGTGRFRFTPPLAVERGELERFANTPAFDDSITQAILLFSDSTAEQLRALTFHAAEIPGDIRGDVEDLLGKFAGDHEGSFDGAIIGPLLNAENSGFFLAHLRRAKGDRVLFQYDPRISESVELYRPGDSRWGPKWSLVTHFAPARPLPGSTGVWSLRDRLSIPRYRLEVWLTPTGSGDLDFKATATFTVTAREPLGPWLHFGLHPKLVVESAFWSDGTAATMFKAKDGTDLWIRASRPLARGDSLALTVAYRGNLIDRYGDWFFIDPTADWWPTNQQGPDNALFDITYHSPSWYPLASVGERVDSTVSERMLTTHWVTKRPSPFATFNLGVFENYHVDRPGEPVLDVLISEDGHRLLRRQSLQAGVVMLEQKHMRENVAADVSNSLKWFTHLFGEPASARFWVTEIPYAEGVAFPGVIHLGWFTFSNTQADGFDEFFRAHEVAHQWWGNGVRPASYRDVWLSEGLATFAGLWYLQSVRKSNEQYFKFLDEYAGHIRDIRDKTGPVSVGYRNAGNDPSTYQTMIYEKGGWIFHMLRTMMLDLQTRKEDRFTAMMREFYTSNEGYAASSEDFQSLVERHIGVGMGWFFDQWLHGTALPTYHVAWKNETTEAGQNRVRLRVTQAGVPSDFQSYVLVSANLGSNRFANFRLKVHGGQTEYFSPPLPTPAKEVTFNELHSVLAEVKMERW